MKGLLGVLGISASLAFTACAPQGQMAQVAPKSASGIIGGTVVQSGDPITQSIVGLIMELPAQNQSAQLLRKRKQPTAPSQPTNPQQPSNPGQMMVAVCTGTLVTNDIVLTAAHCVAGNPTKIYVVFGNDFSAVFDPNATTKPNIQVAQGTSYAINPLWAKNQNNETNTGDTALVKFQGQLPQGFQPAQILPNASALAKGNDVVVAGYGADIPVQQSAIINTAAAPSDGVGVLREVTVPVVDPNFSQTEVEIGATHKTVCHGDSGGPAFVQENGQYYLWGVTSRGDCEVTSIETSILAYVDSWLKPTVDQLEQGGQSNSLNGVQLASIL